MSSPTAVIGAALGTWAESATDLGRLDAELGDGDLGITITQGCEAVQGVLAGLNDDATPPEVLKAVAKAFANANPSTFAALTAGALLNGARAVSDASTFDVETGVAVGRAAVESVAKRGKSEVGDKTVLDALVPAVDALAGASRDAARAVGDAAEAARRGMEGTIDLQSQKGRAAWLGERSRGHADPGAAALVAFLEALRDAIQEQA